MRANVKIASLVLGVVLLVGAIGVGAAYAADPTPTAGTPASHAQALLGKVAKILGIDEQKVTDAFKQAGKELRSEQIDQSVTDGRMTQEYGNWLKQMPDDGKLGLGGRGFGPKGGMCGHGGRFGGMPYSAPSTTPVPSQSQ